MSFGHFLSGKRDAPVHYVFGAKPETKKWYQKRVGWFGHSLLLAIVIVFGVFTSQVHDMILQAAGSQLSSLSPAELHPKGDKQQPLSIQTPAAATNIVEVQPLLAAWAKSHDKQQWGMVVRSLNGPQMDASVQPNAQFDSRGMYKIYLATAIYEQTPVEKQYATIKVNGRSVTITSCMEKMFKEDDRDCTDALGRYLNPSAAASVFKKFTIKHTTLQPATRTAKTTATDTAELFNRLDGSVLSDKANKQLLKFLGSQPQNQLLTVSCPGCTTVGISDYGVGRFEAAGIVTYSKGSYLFIMYANGGTKDLVTGFSGKLQQKIVETTTNAFKP